MNIWRKNNVHVNCEQLRWLDHRANEYLIDLSYIRFRCENTKNKVLWTLIVTEKIFIKLSFDRFYIDYN